MHEHISIWDTKLQTGGVVRVRLYVIYAHLCNHILLQSGGGTWGTALYTVRGVGSGSRDVDTCRANAVYPTDGLEHGGVSLGRMAY